MASIVSNGGNCAEFCQRKPDRSRIRRSAIGGLVGITRTGCGGGANGRAVSRPNGWGAARGALLAFRFQFRRAEGNAVANMGDLLWTPSAERVTTANITAFIGWLNARGHSFANYEELRRWSVDDIAAFWEAVWEYFDVKSSTPYECVLRGTEMPGATWFPGARVNYIETLLSKGDGAKTAIWAA
ncbi:MAG: acetyl-coenzyme A synthetase N-terminal domain-containing protein, partial [Parvibaculum sp.]|nr:acetyl-coenzyme A synthetase N-terminal domain-containing protein [Parvibaculum sp.]